ncbi:MAG: methylmalonyl-CoA mutase family protein [Deltaproteobacteria bacterium]|nr:methylmalonyl-CoA mutase family protein [Deltaproteobacteria bacterium]MCL5791523.1 methylmalonyl-CoA mutase family protein [Deltaproteobacteria bacterium]
MNKNDKLKNGIREYEQGLSGVKKRKDRFETFSHINLEDLYTPESLEPYDYVSQLGFPGEYPFTRGIQPLMYRTRLWTMRQYAGFGDALKTNQRFRYLLDAGQTGLSVAFDLPTQMGYDPDSPFSAGEVGRVGVSISTLKDMEILFDKIPLDKVSTSMTINATAIILLTMYMAVADKQHVPHTKLQGTIQNDILKEYIARGTYIFPVEPSIRITTDIFAYCKSHLPNFNTISISGYHIREAGANAVQELAFTFADAIEYVKSGIKAGLVIDDFAPRLSFFFGVHNNLIEEIAKFRAARRIWAKIMKDIFHAENPKSMMLRFHTQTCGSTLTAQQPDNNIIRVTIQALASALGGTQSLHTNSKDEALALPTEASVKLALRTQQIIAHESGIADFVDPLAGSYAVESLTNEIEKKVMNYLDKIEKTGGAVKWIQYGMFKNDIEDSAYVYQQAIEKKESIIVGVNEFTDHEDGHFDILKVDPEIEKAQIKKLNFIRKNRDNESAEQTLKKLKQAARSQENLMPHIYEAVKAYTSIGEISSTLKEVFGEFR